jgi:hypothetical protein
MFAPGRRGVDRRNERRKRNGLRLLVLRQVAQLGGARRAAENGAGKTPDSWRDDLSVFDIAMVVHRLADAVYRHLQPFRERIVRAGIVASSLYDLASAEPKQIEEVLAAREAGRKLTGAQIKEMLGKTKTASTSPEDGGPSGLRARIAEKTATALPELMANAFALLEMVLASLEPHRRGKTVVVSEIQRPLIHPARMVQQQLEWLTWVAVPAPKGFHPHAIHHSPIVKGDRWDELHATLYKLGSVEQWPRAAEVGAWLQDIVVPQLAWLLGGRADKALAAVEKFDAAAAAERKKAADEKTAARLARKKAKLEQERAAGEAVASLPGNVSEEDAA